jgi:pSer/pThr/pTyr-binding forkhead associated (FHA) protein
LDLPDPPPPPLSRPPPPPHAKVTTNATDTQVARAKFFVDVNGVRHPVNPPGLVVGRGDDADLRINDPGVSRKHIQFKVEGQRLSVHDLGSTNGMLVDGNKAQQATLYNGSSIRIGNTTMTVSLVSGDE